LERASSRVWPWLMQTGEARNFGDDKTVFAGIQQNSSCHRVTSARRISSARAAVFPGPPE
jgi:hypothetical protein